MSQPREGWHAATSGGSDQGTVRRANLALVLRSLRDDGKRSRARLAADLGLNKGTVSSLVSELIDRGLLREGSAERGAVGRPARSWRSTALVRSGSAPRSTCSTSPPWPSTWPVRPSANVGTSVDTRGLDPEQVVDRLVELLSGTMADLAERGAAPVSVVVGVAGLVDHDRGTVSVAPNLGWQDVPWPAWCDESWVTPPTSSRSPTRPTSPPSRRPRPVTPTAATSSSSTARWASVAGSSPTAAPCRAGWLRRGVRAHGGRAAVVAECGCGRTGVLGDRHRPQPADRAGLPTRATCSAHPTSTSRQGRGDRPAGGRR